MIASFKHKGLRELFQKGRSAKICADFRKPCKQILDLLASAAKTDDLNVPGYDFHPLVGGRAGKYAMKVNAAWRITFGWVDGKATDVYLEQYH